MLCYQDNKETGSNTNYLTEAVEITYYPQCVCDITFSHTQLLKPEWRTMDTHWKRNPSSVALPEASLPISLSFPPTMQSLRMGKLCRGSFPFEVNL